MHRGREGESKVSIKMEGLWGMGYSGERRGFSSPLNVGETYDVTIEDVGREGDGIARIEGFVVFVPNTKKGDSVKIRITKVSRRVAFAEIVAE